MTAPLRGWRPSSVGYPAAVRGMRRTGPACAMAAVRVGTGSGMSSSRTAALDRTDTAYRRPLLTVFLAWLWVMAGVNLAAPLYAVYADEFGFSGLVLTTVFATYAVTLVASLLICGRVADRFGRRPVILAGL